MNLVFYSDAVFEDNRIVDSEVVSLIPNKNSKWAFVPSQTDSTRKYYQRFCDYYAKLGYHDFQYFDLDQEYEPDKLSRLADFDAVYLSGGNTFYFLYKIKEIGADKELYNFAKLPGKTILGVSAGAIILTPTIMNTVVQHQIDGDFDELNKMGLSDYSGLDLVDFEFIPHYSDENSKQLIQKYLPETPNPVFGCPDGSGIIVRSGQITLCGQVSKVNRNQTITD